MKKMLKRAAQFPLGKYQEVRMIQRTYNNTWTMLIGKYDETTEENYYYIKHTEADGKEIQVYRLDDQSIYCFELVSESKILVFFHQNSSLMVIDLWEGSSKSFPFPVSADDDFKLFRFSQSGLICLHRLSLPLQKEYILNQEQYTYSNTFWYFSESSLEKGRPLLEYNHTYKLLDSQFDHSFHHKGNKANQHSLITCYSTRPDNTLFFLLHDVVLDQGKAKSRVRYLLQMDSHGSLWQLSENTYLQYFYQKPLEGPLKVEKRVLKNKEESKKEQIVVKSFPFKPKIQSSAAFSHCSQPIVFNFDEGICWNLEKQQMLKTFNAPSSSWDSLSYQDIQWPSYKKDRASRIISTIIRNPQRSFSQSSLNPFILFEDYINEDNKSFTVKTIEISRKKDKLMHLLLALNQDFDDDLLQDALDLIDCL